MERKKGGVGFIAGTMAYPNTVLLLNELNVKTHYETPQEDTFYFANVSQPLHNSSIIGYKNMNSDWDDEEHKQQLGEF
jgi:hypothetical protein